MPSQPWETGAAFVSLVTHRGPGSRHLVNTMPTAGTGLEDEPVPGTDSGGPGKQGPGREGWGRFHRWRRKQGCRGGMRPWGPQPVPSPACAAVPATGCWGGGGEGKFGRAPAVARNSCAPVCPSPDVGFVGPPSAGLVQKVLKGVTQGTGPPGGGRAQRFACMCGADPAGTAASEKRVDVLPGLGLWQRGVGKTQA